MFQEQHGTRPAYYTYTEGGVGTMGKTLNRRLSHGLVLFALPALLASGGCLFGGGGSGGGLFGFFGGGSGSGETGSSLVASFASSGGGFDSIAQDVATIQNPEPASMVLFGGGMAGVAFLRRRKARTRKSTAR